MTSTGRTGCARHGGCGGAMRAVTTPLVARPPRRRAVPSFSVAPAGADEQAPAWTTGGAFARAACPRRGRLGQTLSRTSRCPLPSRPRARHARAVHSGARQDPARCRGGAGRRVCGRCVGRCSPWGCGLPGRGGVSGRPRPRPLWARRQPPPPPQPATEGAPTEVKGRRQVLHCAMGGGGHFRQPLPRACGQTLQHLRPPLGRRGRGAPPSVAWLRGRPGRT